MLFRSPTCGSRRLRAVVLGTERTAEELGRAFAKYKVITSGGTEPVADAGSGGHSVFAYYFLKALRENNAPYLTSFELYNGFGYRNHKKPSAYLWAGSNQYEGGKFVKDGVFDPNARDQQLGCMVLFEELTALDPSLALKRDMTRPQPEIGRAHV